LVTNEGSSGLKSRLFCFPAILIGDAEMSVLNKSVKGLAVLILAGMVSTSAHAQLSGQYAHGKSYFPNPLAPYAGRSVAAPNFANSGRVDSLVHDGKLMLSLSDAITLALENNLDLAIARYNLPIADTDILRAKAGASVRGVNTGIVQGTPGGTGTGVTGGAGATGGGAGGTSTAAGGAGAGAAGIVSSTLGVGAPIESFDPQITSTLQLERAGQQNTSPLLPPLTRSNTGLANFVYSQGFATGTDLAVSFNNSRVVTDSPFTTISPALSSTLRFTLRQHLLQGFGLGTNLRQIRIAKNNREISDVAFRQQVISTVTQIQNIYWDLVNAYEDVKAKERSVALAENLLANNRKQVEIGTLAPIEVVSAQSEVAARNQDLIVSQTNLQLQQLLMKNAITRNLNDQTLAEVPVIPTDTMELPKQEPVVPVQDLIADALAHRPELAQSQIDLTNREISKKSARNALLPSVDVYAFYGAATVGGNQNIYNTCGPDVSSFCTPAGTIPSTGYDNVFNNLFNGTAPDKGVGFQINIPIRNRSAQADQVRSELEYRQAQMRLQQLQNQIRIDVRNNQFAVQQNRARVDAATKARQLALETMEAEQKKYALGASTSYNVLQTQRDLATAEGNLVAAMTAYEKSKVALDEATGLTLTHLGIEIADAESGNVQKMPIVPGVAPRNDLTSTQQQNQVVPQVMPEQHAAPAQNQTQAPPENPSQNPTTH
jgi:outer membrane protein